MTTQTLETPTPAQVSLFGGMKPRRASDTGPGGDREWGWCFGLYGKGGSGKTTLAVTIAGPDDDHHNPYGWPCAVLDKEGGTNVISDRNDIDVFDVVDWMQIQRFAADCADIRKPLPWKSIILDNFCEMSDAEMATRVAKGHTPELRDYNLNTINMVAFARFWRDLSRSRGVNVIFNFWDETDKSESSGLWETRFATTPKMANKLQGVLDTIGYLTVADNSDERILSFAPNRRSANKFRRAPTSAAMKIPLVIPKPDLGEILSVLKGGAAWDASKHASGNKKAETEPAQESA